MKLKKNTRGQHDLGMCGVRKVNQNLWFIFFRILEKTSQHHITIEKILQHYGIRKIIWKF